jgi:acyl carrier protein
MNDNAKLLFIEGAIRSLFNKDITGLTPEHHLSDLGLDSLDIVELVMFYEDEMHVEIVSDEVAVTVADLMALMA